MKGREDMTLVACLLVCAAFAFLAGAIVKQIIEDRVLAKQPKKWMVWVDTRGKTDGEKWQALMDNINSNSYGKAMYDMGDLVQFYVYDPYPKEKELK